MNRRQAIAAHKKRLRNLTNTEARNLMEHAANETPLLRMEATLHEISGETYLIVDFPKTDDDQRKAYVFEIRSYPLECVRLEWTDGCETPIVSSSGAKAGLVEAVFRIFDLP